MRVKCANCKMIYDRSGKYETCLKCGSNAYDLVQAKPAQKPERHQEEVPAGPRLLLDDEPPARNPLLG